MAFGIAGLALLFLLTAALYASVGFGGGSTYIALLALADLDYRILPIIALLCNIIVVMGATLRFQVRRLIDWRRIWPILLLSVPAAWAGGLLVIDRDSFLILLGLSLVVAGLLLLAEPFFRNRHAASRSAWSRRIWFAPTIGGAIGFLSGMVGIGGGIFLAPLLFLTNWADSRRIAATASVFILVNSASGLVGQLMKSQWEQAGMPITSYWPLFLAVFIGGQIGSFFASKALPEHWIQRLTALLILYVAMRILWEQFG
ncbi:sulfite exporter TauE/SafE family protein [Parasphingorhabdus cellanae]|uniref:Probable membrane transporter protein n=1 Tax=Parasphingorhabdus cellanae TaxID=2806553 RepID=A0ABX7T5S7_9SPHN|nr:sulfite exporter TauE/SafE family protein [Parasphingorhabdus cellanae]QTD56122.1 sulfite exporter TauE/SafE family protein [Parasphingorhabdus cellanae]